MRSLKRWIIPIVFLGAIGVVAAVFVIQAGDESDLVSKPVATLPTLDIPSETPSPTPTPSATETCEGPDTQFNLEGEQKSSLLPDCGQEPVTVSQQQASGLSLGCGGKYPSILFKTDTGATKVSICGKDSSGVDFRVVVKERGQDIQDLSGDYVWQRDAFVGKRSGVTYEIRGYDGSVHITKDGKTSVQEAEDWMSLENEPDDG